MCVDVYIYCLHAEYAQVLKMLGNGRVMALCVDGVNRLCHIRGKMRKKVWINAGDVVLVSLRDYQDEKGDIIHKYTPDDVRTLRAEGDFPEAFRLQEFGNAAEGAGPEDEDIFFGSDDEVIDLEQI